MIKSDIKPESKIVVVYEIVLAILAIVSVIFMNSTNEVYSILQDWFVYFV